MGGVSPHSVSLMNLVLPLIGVLFVFFVCVHAGAWLIAAALAVEQAVLWYALARLILEYPPNEEGRDS